MLVYHQPRGINFLEDLEPLALQEVIDPKVLTAHIDAIDFAQQSLIRLVLWRSPIKETPSSCHDEEHVGFAA